MFYHISQCNFFILLGDDKNSTVSNSECSDTYNGAITGQPLDYQRLELLHENLMYSITGDKIAKFFK